MFRIGDLNIHRLSGPVSFKYLYPREDVFREQATKGVFLPIVILLRDQYFSERNLCNDCEEQKGCYQVESNSFLNTLNRIALRYPTDFFIEYASRKRPTTVGILFRKFLEKTTHCHNRLLKSVLCDFKNIRWHYADARFWSNDKTEITIPNTIKYLRNLKEKNFTGVMKEDNMRLFRGFLKAVIDCADRNDELSILTYNLSTILHKELVNNKNSIVYKQFKKTRIDYDDINIGLYCKFSLDHHLKGKLHMDVKDLFHIPDVIGLSEFIFEGKSIDFDKIQDYKNLIGQLEELWVQYTACVLDLYLLARMLKTTINSYLTVAFIGHYHSDAISNFLYRYLRWYDLRFERDFMDDDRCIQIATDVDFNRDLEDYANLRAEYETV